MSKSLKTAVLERDHRTLTFIHCLLSQSPRVHQCLILTDDDFKSIFGKLAVGDKVVCGLNLL